MKSLQKTIFVVDDGILNLSMAEDALEHSYRVFTIPSAAGMFDFLKKITPDLILLDIKMPEMDGFQALRKLKSISAYADIPVIFLTGSNEPAEEVMGFELGAVDFIRKPFSAPALHNRVATHLDIAGLIHKQTAQLRRLQSGILSVLGGVIEHRDKDTGGHIERTSTYVRFLIDAMSTYEIFSEELQTWNPELAIASSRLHDVGKIVITDTILNKAGKLTVEEFEIIKTHAQEGERIIDDMITWTKDESFLHSAKQFAGYHHEKWDGSGYPRGLAGDAIPLQGRIMAVVDVYDALVSERPYKKAMDHETAVGIIMAGSGSHFDPRIADIFYQVHEKFNEVKEALSK